MSLIPQLTDAGKAMMVKAMTGQQLNFTLVKLGDSEAPSSIHDGDCWYDTENSLLYRYASSWMEADITVTASTTAPTEANAGDYWYNTSTGVLYQCDNGWVIKNVTITCSTVAPTSPSLGDYWYDTANSLVYCYQDIWASLDTVNITCDEMAPDNPAVGDYWFNILYGSLSICTAEWSASAIAIDISETEPENPTDGEYWYDTANSVLYLCEASTDDETLETTLSWTQVESQPITYSDTTPENPSDGDWWLDSSDGTLYAYTYSWENDSTHVMSYGTSAPEDPAEGDWWFDTSLHVYTPAWAADRNQSLTYGAAAPDEAEAGDWWYDTTNKILRTYGIVWSVNETISLTYSSAVPYGSDGEYWYDSDNDEVFVYYTGWSLLDEQVFYYSSTTPVSPEVGDWWYEVGGLQLYEYNGTNWVASNVTITCSVGQPNTADILTDLVNPLMEASISEIIQGSNYVSLTCVLSNNDLEEGFKWCETGVFATIDGGTAELYAYCDAGDLYDYIPSNSSGRTINETFTLLIMVGDADNVTATIGAGAVYATKQALNEHLKDEDNPHGVTAAQLGLDKVVNDAPSDMTIDFDTTVATLSELTSGETTASLFCKVKAAVSALMTHLKASNPHSITPTKIGAAETSHTHTMSDLNGTLSVAKGGTGCSTLEEFATALNEKMTINDSSVVCGWYTGTGVIKRKIELDFTPSAVILSSGRGMGNIGYWRASVWYYAYGGYGGVWGGIAVGSRGVRAPGCTAVSHEYSWSDSHTAMLITDYGFYVNVNISAGVCTNIQGETYRYIAFK